jgi:hypothetical protein
MIALKCVSKTFNSEIKRIIISKQKLEEKLEMQKDQTRLEFLKEHLICINKECQKSSGICRSSVLMKAMGPTTYFYPEETIDPKNYDDNPHGPNYEAYYREQACLRAPKINRFIPYCFECMLEHVEYGCKDQNPYSVPFGRNEPEYML